MRLQRPGRPGSAGTAVSAGSPSALCHQPTSCHAPCLKPTRRYTPIGSKVGPPEGTPRGRTRSHARRSTSPGPGGADRAEQGEASQGADRDNQGVRGLGLGDALLLREAQEREVDHHAVQPPDRRDRIAVGGHAGRRAGRSQREGFGRGGPESHRRDVPRGPQCQTRIGLGPGRDRRAFGGPGDGRIPLRGRGLRGFLLDREVERGRGARGRGLRADGLVPDAQGEVSRGGTRTIAIGGDREAQPAPRLGHGPLAEHGAGVVQQPDPVARVGRRHVPLDLDLHGLDIGTDREVKEVIRPQGGHGAPEVHQGVGGQGLDRIGKARGRPGPRRQAGHGGRKAVVHAPARFLVHGEERRERQQCRERFPFHGASFRRPLGAVAEGLVGEPGRQGIDRAEEILAVDVHRRGQARIEGGRGQEDASFERFARRPRPARRSAARGKGRRRFETSRVRCHPW